MKETTGEEIKRVAVIGTGLMGPGIAQAFAIGGYNVNLLSRSKGNLDRAFQEIEWSLNKFVEKQIISRNEADAALDKIKTTTAYDEALKDEINAISYYEASAKENIQVENIFQDITLAILKNTQKV